MRYEERRELDEPVAQGLLQNIGGGILLTDREEEIQFMNPAAEKILGVTGEAESARFSAVCPLVNVETGEAYPSPIPRVIRTRRAAGLARNIGIFRGEEKVYLSATCSPVGDMNGGVAGCSIILRDISKLRQLEMRAEKDRADAEDARQRAVEASRVKDRFLEALDLYLESIERQEPYDLLCLDIMMPKVDGLKTLKVIRGLEKQYAIPPEDHLKIIMMTAISDVDYVKEAFKLGCDAYASKPIDVQKVEEVMKHIGLL